MLKNQLAFLALLIVLATSCGSEDKKDTAKTYTFNSDIKPILQSSCGMGNGTCHDQSAGDNGIDYVNSKSQFVAAAADIKNRIASDDASIQMPKPGFDKTLSSADRAKIEDYFAQSTHD